MGREELQTWRGATRVIHWAGRYSDEILGFLEPATTALAESAITQTVVAFDDDHWRRLVPGLRESVEFVLVPRSRNPVQNWHRSLSSMRTAVQDGPVTAIHLHGFLPSLAVAFLDTTERGEQPSIYYSPHASRTLGSLRTLGVVMKAVSRLFARCSNQRIIANMAWEACTLSELTDQPVGLIEIPVADIFFTIRPNRARYPLVLTSTRTANPRGADLITRVAVLFSDKSLCLGFNWLGAQDQEVTGRLRAAGVDVFEAENDRVRAQLLGQGWLYLATGDSRGFPIPLMEAMAVGLPCVALDTPCHRDLIQHGVTGFLYQNEDELLTSIAQLIDSSSMRSMIGIAARTAARGRFSSEQFRESLLATYAQAHSQ